MGSTHSFLITFEKESVDEVLKALASAVDVESARVAWARMLRQR